MTGGKQYCHGT